MLRLGFLAQALLLAAQSAVAIGTAPAASVWYRGEPTGVPRAEDLAAIHEHGFTGVTWPQSKAHAVATLQPLADAEGLTVVVRSDASALTPTSALKASERVDVRVTGNWAMATAPITWRAIAHGARWISFDAGLPAGTGLPDRPGGRAAWAAAEAIARQLRVNRLLFAQLHDGPRVVVDAPRPASLDIVLLEAQKSWVIIATNGSGNRTRAVAHLPATVPYAQWLNLIEGSTLAMLNEPSGPRWNLDLEGWGVGIYLIDKVLK
jgi:hypothetical protein